MNRIKNYLRIFTRRSSSRTAKTLKTILGVLILIIATIMVPIPGPWSTPVYIAGLAVLASEYDTFKDFQDRLEKEKDRVIEKIKARLNRI